MVYWCVRSRGSCSSYHLQLLHEPHDIEHHLCPHHFVLLVEATLQHTVLHTRTRRIDGDSVKILLQSNDSHSCNYCAYRIDIEIMDEEHRIVAKRIQISVNYRS